MKADSLTIADVFKGGGDTQYVLPHFQREYSWEQENWKTLLDDACEIFEEAKGESERLVGLEHFLGSLVVVWDGLQSGVVPVFKLVDGQQRLVSISLLLKALSSCAAEESQVIRRIERLLTNEEEGDLRFKLLPTRKYGDQATYKSIVSGTQPPEKATSRIVEAFEFFQTSVRKKLSDGSITVDGLFTVITTCFQVVFINLSTNESPYRIFESLNAKGKELTQADLVRNYVAMRLPAKDQEYLFENYWSQTEALLQERRLVGRIGELTAFFRHYLSMMGGTVVNERHVYSRFRDRAQREFANADEFVSEIKKLSTFARYYDTLLRPDGSPYPVEIRSALNRLNIIEAQTAYPFLLWLFAALAEKKIDEAQLTAVLGVVENYLVPRFLHGDPTNYQLKMFPTLSKELDTERLGESLKSVLAVKNYPTDGQLISSVLRRNLLQHSARNRRNTVQILQTINQRISEGTDGYTVLKGDPTVEHVMPQTLSDDWKRSLGPLWEQTHSDLLDTLGNLTLVTSEWNSSLSNSPFENKAKKLSGHALAINNRYFTPTATWTRDDIQERGEFLARQILDIWPALDPNLEAPSSEVPATEFSWAALERVALALNAQLLKKSQARFRTGGDELRVVGLSSKVYPQSSRNDYWYGFKPSQKSFLEEGAAGWLALECGSALNLLLVPFGEVEKILPSLSITEGKHWHIAIQELDGRLSIIPKASGEKIDWTQFRIIT